MRRQNQKKKNLGGKDLQGVGGSLKRKGIIQGGIISPLEKKQRETAQ